MKRYAIETRLITTDAPLIRRLLLDGHTIEALALRRGMWLMTKVHGARRRRGRLEIYTKHGSWLHATSATVFPK